MVDEIYEVSQYLDGKNIVHSNLYRVCLQMVRWHKDKGELSRIEIREKILYDWALKHKINVRYNLNDIINRVFDSNDFGMLKSHVVKVNNHDVERIKRSFDNETTKLVALAMLCYAKAHGSKKGEFTMSAVNLGAWLGINRKSLTKKYIKELIDFNYLTIAAKPTNNSKWKKAFAEQSTRYMINAPLHNSGNFELKNNEIGILFSEVFSVLYED